jgi:hypothetical protein
MQKLITVIHRHKSQNFATYSTELEFLKSLWGLGTEEEWVIELARQSPYF